ncbi:MAG: prepilin-type N-terminal cleavage/methylation domain-containing protein [Halanaerobiales bacterium]|nr:prepilin-type N-terminal cleavage/methylation domain-containing protein [Halanaerobiales bacterium]
MLKSQKGVSLIELMVTIAFIGIVIITSTMIFTHSVKVGKISERRNQALNLAVKVIEEIQNYHYGSSSLSQGEHSYNLTDPNSPFTLKYQVTEQGEGENQQLLKEIIVTAQWLESGNQKEVNLTTYRAKTLY